MKKNLQISLKIILGLTLVSTLMFSCSKDDSKEEVKEDIVKSEFSETPTALAKFDASNLGTYKGVFTGSAGTTGETGTIEVDLKEDTKTAILTIDGKKTTYTSTGNFTSRKTASGYITFKNGNSSFDFNVSASGEDPVVTNIKIDGKPFANIIISKEYSDKIVRCYIGTVIDDPSNSNDVAKPFNFCTSGSQLSGVVYDDDYNTLIVMGSVLPDNTFSGSIFVQGSDTSEATFKGAIVNGKFGGTAVNNDGDKFVFNGGRSL